MPGLCAPGTQITWIRFAPDVPLAIFAARRQRRLEPGVLGRGVVEHQVHDDPDVTLVRFAEQALEILHAAVIRIDRVVIGHIVAMVRRRRVDGHQPDAFDPQILKIIELFNDPVEVADAVPIAVAEGADEDLVEDRVVPPGEPVCAFGERCGCRHRSLCRGRSGGRRTA